MKIKFLLSFFTLLTIFSCTQEIFVGYGEDINSDVKFYDAIGDNLDISNVSGEILDVCPKKGCWVKVDVNSEEVFVTFKNYSFFVPKEGIQGKKIIINGDIKIDTISIPQLKHYAYDAGKSEDIISKIKEPKITKSIEATGVAIID